MSGLRLFSRNGVETTRGSAEIEVGDYVVALCASPLCSTVSVSRRNAKLATRTWPTVSPETIRAALEYAERLGGLATGYFPGPYTYGPACVEDASGACVNPLHDHPTGAAR